MGQFFAQKRFGFGKIIGVEIDTSYQKTTLSSSYSDIFYQDAIEFLEKNVGGGVIFGNPPYFKDWRKFNRMLELGMQKYDAIIWLVSFNFTNTVARMNLFQKYGFPKEQWGIVPRLHWQNYKDSSPRDHCILVWTNGSGPYQHGMINWKTGQIV